jgi:hypothetical protein
MIKTKGQMNFEQIVQQGVEKVFSKTTTSPL